MTDIDKIIEQDLTLQYYNDHAEQFAENTIDADMEDIRTRFLAYLPAGAWILDFGCGTGRDAKAFKELGYEVSAIDGSEALCDIASKHAGVPVRCMDFRNYIPDKGEVYEGIWACASLLHLKKEDLISVFGELSKALCAGGAMYVSFKYGDFEGIRNDRYFTDFSLDNFKLFIKNIPELRIVEHWMTGDVRSGRADEKWLNVILEKVSFAV